MARQATTGCEGCDAPWVAGPAVVRHAGSGRWTRVQDDTPVDVALLFRDPGIRDVRQVETVLDLREERGELRAGTNCWVRGWLAAIGTVPVGLTAALDNGVRCPCPVEAGPAEYQARAARCHARTSAWLRQLAENAGRESVPVLLCDKSLVHALGALGRLRRGPAPWVLPSGPYVGQVCTSLTLLDTDDDVLAPARVFVHPQVLNRSHAAVYRVAIRNCAAALLGWLGLGGDVGEA